MKIKFNEIVYRNTYEIELGTEEFNVVVEVTDAQSEVLANLMKGTESDIRNNATEIEAILIKDIDFLKSKLKGINYTNFLDTLIIDYADFFINDRMEVIKNLISQKR
jgi:hypothetical protein